MLPSKGILKIQKLLDEPPLYGKTICSLFSFIISALICALAFGGSLNDMWVAGFMGLLVRFIECYTSAPTLSQGGALIFCIFFVSFIARAAASFSSQVFCFYAISSAGVIGLLPGYIICKFWIIHISICTFFYTHCIFASDGGFGYFERESSFRNSQSRFWANEISISCALIKTLYWLSEFWLHFFRASDSPWAPMPSSWLILRLAVHSHTWPPKLRV